ncbi:hypothetical protein ACFFGT_31710 [Mucilaginibacter angelicae]|uniref:Uncharacterized protein n=1 Tax=Mucilaginibacter angelicae TaxID=869718 RepID=A0ABV6LH98_9SPHI
MRKLLTVLIGIFNVFVASAQSDSVYTVKSFFASNSPDSVYHHLPDAKENVPTHIINANIITNLNFIDPKTITGINVLKDDAKLPAKFRNLNKYGLITIDVKAGTKINTKSFKEIGKWLNMKGPVKYAVDGFFIDDENMLIATDSILGMEVTLNKYNQTETGATINVWTLAPSNRKGLLQVKRATDKPGVIYIR